MCNNILLAGGSVGGSVGNNSNFSPTNRRISHINNDNYTGQQKNTNNDDVIKMRLSQLKKNAYPSFSNTPKLYNVGNSSNNNNLMMSSSASLHSHSHSNSHSRKKLTIEIPQSPHLQHNPSQNPYYKV